ncbi:double-strand break repair helicase AddA [Marimonas sp. MJW-29]|uniref:DNA 3'-5' helicase n=1 Tax=Sulfitobacter sediminis TaxID=3234186 RepID=A0ABV3RNG5_9RHOB
MGWHDALHTGGSDLIFNDATRAQIEAARPDVSTWLGANAGSGKTRVLTDRVARFLLNGVNPQNILCLTYTKAAASEMQNRLFKRLGAWAMLGDDDLRAALAELGFEGTLDAERLRRARTLFALAIETPGGLKIQTIHSFCAALLRRFPLEAQVSPQFTEIEDRAADLLRADIVDEMSDGPEAALVAELAHFYSGEDLGRLTKMIVGMREAFATQLSRGDILFQLGQSADLDQDRIEATVFTGEETALIRGIVPVLLEKGGNDEKAGRALEAISRFDLSALPELERQFLFGASAKAPFCAKIDSFPTKLTRATLGEATMDRVNAFMRRVEDARDARLALETAEKTVALHAFARAFLRRYEAAKQQRGWLDFDDLILKARALLRDDRVAPWILFRIDGGIDHILVDEAQDTSPRQWDVIEALTAEFYSGAGARPDVDRTLFVVGDKKQSIYSFQGADPQEFDRKREMFGEKFEEAGKVFQKLPLEYSFRSSSAILRLVDTVFDPRRRSGFDAENQHIAFKDTLPGRVDLWPVVDPAATDDDGPWTDPVDRRSAQHHTVVLAQQIAEKIKTMIDPADPAFIPDDAGSKGSLIRRPVRAGDFLILVQRRSALFAEIIRACKAEGLPIAGADRLKVGAELAVKDLAALLAFLATPDDSLSLATALKSPLFGWREQDLFTLANGRKQPSLWETLRKAEDLYPETLSVLRDLRAQVDFLRPFDLIERILTRHEGRKRLLARLGPEAEDGINAMLTQALAYERTDIPSLTGFIAWMQTDDLEIKRQIDSASDQIRVMTVHGSKGLEAPIVILPDTGKRDITIRNEIVSLNGTPVWKPSADDMPAPITARIDEMKAAEHAERLRLLYVAMTRAEKWLIVAAAGELAKDNSTWYQITEEAMGHINAEEVGKTGIRRFQEGDWDGLSKVEEAERKLEKRHLETVFLAPAPDAPVIAEVLTPSDLGGAKALPGDLGEETEAAKDYGSVLHELLERLPQLEEPARTSAARQITRHLDNERSAEAIAEAVQVITLPTLADVFSPNSLTEIPITGTVSGRRLHGVIDRLLIGDDVVQLIDYKTNRQVPDRPETCPEGLLRQMGAYAALLSQTFPAHEIKTAILWTANATLMPLSHDLVTAALWRSDHLDAGDARS